jgi:pimeloyl-ACP methyl ester carboxylesterase
VRPHAERPRLAWLGPAPRVPLVAVHGNFASKRWFARLVGDPPEGSEVYAPDLPGFGESAELGSEAPSIGHFADALTGFIEALGLRRPILLGHSLGGAVVAETALRDPGRVRGLVFISSPPLDGYRTPPTHYPVLQQYRHDRVLLRASLATLFHGPPPPEFESLVDDARAMHPAGFQGNSRALDRWNALDRAERLREIPTLILGGERDPLILPGDVHRLGEQISHAVVRLYPEVGHCLPLEDPVRLRDALWHFLQEGV